MLVSGQEPGSLGADIVQRGALACRHQLLSLTSLPHTRRPKAGAVNLACEKRLRASTSLPCSAVLLRVLDSSAEPSPAEADTARQRVRTRMRSVGVGSPLGSVLSRQLLAARAIEGFKVEEQTIARSIVDATFEGREVPQGPRDLAPGANVNLRTAQGCSDRICYKVLLKLVAEED